MSETTFEQEEPGRAVPLAELRLLLSRLRRTLDCDRIAVWVPAYGSEETEVLAEAGETVPWSSGAGPAPVCRWPGPLHPAGAHVVPDLSRAAASALESALLRHGFRTFAAVPLDSGGDRVGTLAAFGRAPGRLTEDTLPALTEAAPILAAVTHHLLLLERHRQHARVLRIAHRILLDLAGEGDLRAACLHVVRKLRVYLDGETSALYLWNRPSGWLSCEAVSRGDPAERPGDGLLPGLDPRTVPALEPVLGGEPLHFRLPAATLDTAPPALEPLALRKPGDLLVLPILLDRSVSGILLCRRAEAAPPGRLLEAWPVLGKELGRLLENRRTGAGTARDVALLGDILGLEAEVAAGDPSRGPEVVARRARALVAADDATVFELEPDGRTLRPVAALGSHAAQLLTLRIRMGEGITGTVAATRRAEIANESHRDTRAVTLGETPSEAEAMLALPLLAGDTLHGVLTVHKLQGRTFDRHDLNRLEIFATAAGNMLRNAGAATRLTARAEAVDRLLDRLPVGVILAGADGTLRQMNARARETLAPKGDGESGDRALQAAALEPVRRAVRRRGGSSSRVLSQEVTLGESTYLLTLSRPEEEGDGVVAVLFDVTDRKEAEARMLQASKMSAVGQLAAGVAHEFNNLIAGIYGYAQLMREHREEKVVERGVNVILQSSERARELTTSLLSFSRRRPGRREPVDLNQVLTDTLLLMSRHLERAGVRVQRNLGRIPHTVADAARLQQVFLDLILNAQQAMSEGGQLEITTEALGGEILIKVADNGPGIAPADLSRIFEPFFTTKGPLGGTSVPGTGLGLSAAYNIVQDHGGSLRAQSTPGEGAVFSILLPVKTLHEHPTGGAPPRVPERLDCTGRIVVVEGDAALRRLMVDILEDLGHQVIEAPEGADVPEILSREPCDMLIIDRMTSGMENLGVYTSLRQSHPKLPVLFITGRGTSVESDGDPWMFRINKPFRNRDLVALVSRVLSQSLDTAS